MYDAIVIGARCAGASTAMLLARKGYKVLLVDRASLERALADYERRRNEATMPDYQRNLAQARFHPLPAEIAQLRLALRGNQADTNRYYLAIEGMIPPEEFFDPRNLQRIVELAGAGGAVAG